MHVATVKEINDFLKQYRKLMYQHRNFRFVPRTFAGFTDLGLTLEQAKDEIKTLKYVHYDRGPNPDRNGDGTEIWEFGKPLDGHLVYIKIKISNELLCKCLSFKKSDGPFTLPYRNWG